MDKNPKKTGPTRVWIRVFAVAALILLGVRYRQEQIRREEPARRFEEESRENLKAIEEHFSEANKNSGSDKDQ